HGLPRARHEFAVQRHLRGLGYPVPEPVLLEEDCTRFGGPFLLGERVAGLTYVEHLLRRPWRIWHAPREMAALHARLHRLPAGRFPGPSRPFLVRRLEEIDDLVHDHGLTGLAPGLDWLHARRPAPPESPCVLHLDFHPLNLI